MSIYYSPEKYALEIVYDSDGGGGYDWDTVTVFGSKLTGALWIGQDSGCSCNSPFDEINGLDGINQLESIDPRLGRDQIRAIVLAQLDHGYEWTAAEREQKASEAAVRVVAWISNHVKAVTA